MLSCGGLGAARRQISADIHATSRRLAKLTQLVRKGTLFNDRSTDIASLVHDVNTDIRALNTQLESANEFVTWKKSQLGEKNQVRSRDGASPVVTGVLCVVLGRRLDRSGRSVRRSDGRSVATPEAREDCLPLRRSTETRHAARSHDDAGARRPLVPRAVL
jgi:hypothetical protein